MANIEQRANVLGDVRAENDHAMLNSSFYDWPDYKFLSNPDDRFVVVGRRGTGKSALTYRLEKDWSNQRNLVLVISPQEEEFYGLRAAARKYGDSLPRIRAAIKNAWRYTILLDIFSHLSRYYKTQEAVTSTQTYALIGPWQKMHGSAITRLTKVLNDISAKYSSDEERIAALASHLPIDRITKELEGILVAANRKAMILIDRLDEGYEGDAVGIGIVDGIVYGSDSLRTNTNSIRSVLFLRDNIFRELQNSDPDFSRNVEGSVHRLHWDSQELFYLICKRIRKAFNLQVESDIKAWNAVTSNELHGREGFRSCLRFTLYRPRDVILLLNNAFGAARKSGRETLIEDDIKYSARFISEGRFRDLCSEYLEIFPGVEDVARALAEFGSRFSVSDAQERIDALRQTENHALAEHLAILGQSSEAIHALYGVGFLGFADRSTGNIIFSHDGNRPGRALEEAEFLLIHPCYWSALGIRSEEVAGMAEELYDEYEITISSQTREMRNKSLGRLISELSTIDAGIEHAAEFENWCKTAIEILTTNKLTNVQLKPNGNASARRDIVATNHSVGGFWHRIREDYKSRQVVFEVKNFEKINVEEYRQCSSYLVNEYGSCGFIICRDRQKELSRGGELEAFQQFYHQGKMILKITDRFLVALLSKLRSPQKHDVVDEQLSKHLDTHIRLYASGQLAPVKGKRGADGHAFDATP